MLNIEPNTISQSESFFADHVEMRSVDLRVGPDRLRTLSALLDIGEQARADRFATPDLRRRFVVSRAWLRILLSRFLGARPEKVRFRYSATGKPSLAGDLQASGLKFNVSHSGEVALFAFAYRRNLGVDLEFIRPGLDVDQLSLRFFAPAEHAWVMSFPPPDRLRAFYLCWTAKEAYLKGRGDGLGFPLGNFETLPDSHSGKLCLNVYANIAETRRWRLERLTAPAGYVAALALENT